MGVRGLTTFIQNRSKSYLEPYELHDTYLVIDGNCISCQMYRWHCKCNDCYGGDYDKYARVVTRFFQLLKDCNVTPLVIFDGAYEKRKMRTVYERLKDRIAAANNLNSYTEGAVSLFPLFMRELFVDILLKMGVKTVRCDFECDTDAAYLARKMQCPLLSYDSDFFIMDVLYIPFNTFNLSLSKKNGVNYIKCNIYRVDKFLNSFGGMDKINLPLLGVLLGNDYVKRGVFTRFYQQLKLCKSKENEQQRTIKTLILWLKNETPESAMRKILSRFKAPSRRKVSNKIRRAIIGYYGGNPQIMQYFNLSAPISNELPSIEVPEPEEIEDDVDDELMSDEEDDVSDEEDEEALPVFKFTKPFYFRDNYRNCLYPACFMEMLTTHFYYGIPQIEDFSREHSHAICIPILAVLHKILTFPDASDLVCVTRGRYSGYQKYLIPFCHDALPKLEEMESIDVEYRINSFLKILNLTNGICNKFPSSWHLFLISIKYWTNNSKSHIDSALIYSLILCGIVLNYIDGKIGFYRTSKSLDEKFQENDLPVETPPSPKTIINAIELIDKNNSIRCMRKLILYFQTDMKLRTSSKHFDRKIIHEFAQFQSCLLHIKYLNSILNFPFPTFIISEFYNGTFLYNMTANLFKRTDLKAYLATLLAECPAILMTVNLMAEEIFRYIGENTTEHKPSKRRKRKKRSKQVAVEKVGNVAEESGEEFVDENNFYSLLSTSSK